MAESGPATRALLESIAVTSNGASGDGRVLARQVCQACVAGVDVDGAAMSVLTATATSETLWASDATAQRLEELQFTLNEGACIQAAASGRSVLVPDLQHATEIERWPIFAAAVAEQTLVRALFALPLQWGASNLGVIDLYRATPGGLSRTQWNDVSAAVDIAAVLMLELLTAPEALPDRDDQDQDGSSSTDGDEHWLDLSAGNRAEVHQATGMVLVQLGVTATEALARLRGHAFTHRKLLIDVAIDVVNRRLVFTEDMA